MSAAKQAVRPKIIGLTGSIGMGKSTTAKMFADLGCPVFDADAVVHDMYRRGGRAVSLIRAVFPDAIKGGAVDRAILSQHMRKDPLNLPVLESFIHPWVAERRAEFFTKALESGARAVIFDVPLLFETGGDKLVDAVVVVSAPKAVQRERVLSRPGMGADLFEELLSRQMPDREKRARADYIISTGESLEATRIEVANVLDHII